MSVAGIVGVVMRCERDRVDRKSAAVEVGLSVSGETTDRASQNAKVSQDILN